jgi:hypothetical protein
MIVRTVRIRPRRIAATARAWTEAELADRQAQARLPPHIDEMCRDWGHWVATRRLAAPRPLGSVLGRLRTATSTAPGEGPRVRLDQHLAAFHCALQAQDERGVSVLWAMYALPAQGVRLPVRRVAEALHMDRSTAYRLRDRVATAAYGARERVIQTHLALGVRETGAVD